MDMSNSSSHMKSQARQLEEKLRGNEQIGKKNKPKPKKKTHPKQHFLLPAKQSNHLVLFPNCDDSRTHVTRNLME